MKKRTHFYKILVVICLFVVSCSNDNETIDPINDIYLSIPDARFETILVNSGIDTDGVVDQQMLRKDAEQVSRLNLNFVSKEEGEISDLTGIEGFKNLKQLYAIQNSLTDVDLSSNTLLDTLYLQGNSITSMDISHNSKLILANVGSNLLRSFSGLSKATQLKELNLSNNDLEEIIIDNESIETLFISDNLLKSIDVGGAVNLKNIFLKTNKITTLDLSNNTLLETLVLSDNNFESINIEKNSKLAYLYISSNRLSNLDVSYNQELIDLRVDRNESLGCIKIHAGQSIPTVVKSVYQELSTDCNEASMELPTIASIAITEISAESATSGGDITADGGSDITARGVCWSTSNTPSITDSKTTDGIGVGNFTSSITGLLPNTTYYLRAYATNSIGTSYGEEINFTTGSTIYSGDIYLKNQQEVDDFGSMGYTEVTGDLVIEPEIPTHFSNLKGLSSLTSIGGALIISKTIGLNDFSDLKNLTTVGDYIILAYNQGLTSIGMESLSLVGNYFNIIYNEDLIDLEGLTKLRSNGGAPDLTIWSNTKLKDYCGIKPLLSDFTGIFSVMSNLYNPSQQDIIDGNCSQ